MCDPTESIWQGLRHEPLPRLLLPLKQGVVHLGPFASRISVGRGRLSLAAHELQHLVPDLVRRLDERFAADGAAHAMAVAQDEYARLGCGVSLPRFERHIGGGSAQ